MMTGSTVYTPANFPLPMLKLVTAQQHFANFVILDTNSVANSHGIRKRKYLSVIKKLINSPTVNAVKNGTVSKP